jgi:hypothetical protein
VGLFNGLAATQALNALRQALKRSPRNFFWPGAGYQTLSCEG